MRVEHKKIELCWMERESVVYDAGGSAGPRVGVLPLPRCVCWPHGLLWEGISGLHGPQSLRHSSSYTPTRNCLFTFCFLEEQQ